MSGLVHNGLVIKDANGRYSEDFKQRVLDCIKNGMNSNDTANKLGVEPLGSGYRQLYYKLSREYKLGKSLPTMKVGGISKDERNTADSGIKTIGVIINKKESTVPSNRTKLPKAVVSDDMSFSSMLDTQNFHKDVSTNQPKIKENNTEASSKIKENNTEASSKININNSSKEVSSEFLDSVVNSYKDSLKKNSSVDYIRGSISSKIEAYEDAIRSKEFEIESCRQAIDFLRFLDRELQNL